MEIEILDVNTLFGAYPSQHADSTAESLVQALDEQFVQWCLTLSTIGLFHDDRAGNAETLRACQTHPHLIPAATINPANAWLNEHVMAELADSHFELVRFFPHAQGWPLRYLPFRDVVGTLAARERTPIMISVERTGDITAVADELRDYPHPVILDGVRGELLAEAVAALRACPLLYIETHGLTVPGALEFIKERIGIERILFGSGAPGWSLASALRYVKRSGLSDDDKLAVLGANAQGIWHSSEGA